jgi:pantoate--beta-alanine ligase
VCTVVAKLFHLCDPAVAVFGEKDAQQLRVIERMVRDLDFPVRILRGPIVREPDGLAMSSRNARLSPEARRQATCLRCALDRAEALAAGGERSPAVLVSAMREILDAAPLARTDYIQIVAEDTLEPLGTLDRPALVALAVCLGDVRLIDNTPLPLQKPG